MEPVPDFLDYEMWTGPAPLRPYDGLPHVRWWRTFMEYGNGIMGDMCVHLLDTVRWMLGLGWPKRISSSGGIYVQKEGKSNIAATRRHMLDFLAAVERRSACGASTASPGSIRSRTHILRRQEPAVEVGACWSSP